MNYKTTGIIFADISNGNLNELTAHRPTASIPFGGRYRLIDFMLSNFHYSDITQVGIVVQGNYRSLMDHLGSGKDWDLSRKHGGLSILPPMTGQRVYHTWLEALYGLLAYLEKDQNELVILSDSDIICSINLDECIHFHLDRQADVTIVYRKNEPGTPPKENSHAYHLDDDGRIHAVSIAPSSDESLLGMHIMVFNKICLLQIIREAMAYSLTDLHRDFFQKNNGRYRLFGWEFTGYAKQVDSLQNYLDANIDLLTPTVREELFYKNGPVCTRVRDEVPAQYGEEATVTNSFIADGCTIEGNVQNSILFRGVKVGKGAKIINSVILKNSTIGENVTLDSTVADKEVQIADSRTLMGYRTYPLYISSGSII
ncbi:MAG TPA: glucose-1-phosphate adenylyltransferase subunit GlgD [Ruminococcaceae bacterium]|nr:glucose-1-phosphate adenylyltransferase subunit GlgD [Oscillospiraceae bacterium]